MNPALQHEHLDTDQLNAFAEGVLPEHERLLVMTHLADCPRCREVVFLAQEALAMEAPTGVVAEEPVRAPFWKRWFGPLPLAGAAALACAAVAFVMFRTPATVQAPQNQVAAVKQEQPPMTAPLPAANKKAAPVQSPTEIKLPPPPKPMNLAASPPHILSPSSAVGSAAASSESITADQASIAPIAGSANGSVSEPKSQAAKASSRGSFSMGAGLSVAQPPVAAAPLPPSPQKPETAKVEARSLNQLLTDDRDAKTSPVVSGSLAAPAAYAALRAPGDSGIAGKITDASGAAIPGATITLRSGEKALAKSSKTDALGRFSLSGLAPGSYEVAFTAPGFQPQKQTVNLQPRQVAQLDSKLPIGAVTETVAVEHTSITSAKRRSTDLCDDPLPSGKSHSQCQISGSRALAVDQSGGVFVRKGNGHWKAMEVPWTGSIKSVGVLGSKFEIVTVDGAMWLSGDGRHWKLQASH